MITFLYGLDGYRIKRRRASLIQDYQTEYPHTATWVLDIQEPHQLETLESALKTDSLFNDQKIITIANAFVNAGTIHELIERRRIADSHDCFVVMSEQATATALAKQDKVFFKFLTTAPVKTELFEPLNGKALEQWLQTEAQAHGCALEPLTLTHLIRITSQIVERPKRMLIADSWRLGQEISKLASYARAHQRQVITPTDVTLLVHPNTDIKIFDLLDALADRNKRKAVVLLHQYLEQDFDPHYIFSMIVYQFRNLVTIGLTPSNALSSLKLNPYVLQKAQRQSRNFQTNELKARYKALVAIDQNYKSGLIDLPSALFDFAIAL